MKLKDVLEKAYGNVPKEPVIAFEFDLEFCRPIKYYWLRFIRFFTR